jgi:hypothetical protein
VTIAHDLGDAALDAAQADLADYEAEFEISGFGLFELQADGMWRAVRTFPCPSVVRAAA